MQPSESPVRVEPPRERDAREDRASETHGPEAESAAALMRTAPGATAGRRLARRHAVLAPIASRPRRALARAAAGATKAALIALLAWGLFFNFSEVRGSSMRPGIEDGDRILVDHVSYLFAEVHRGDVVVMRYPRDPSVDYVKRVVGLPGDRVEIFRGQVWINGGLLSEDYVAAENIDPWALVDTVVEPGHYFVLGDNRLRSSDSREFGQVAESLLRGKVRARLWPITRAGLVH